MSKRAPNYRADFRPIFLAGRRGADALRAFDVAAVFFLAVFLEALRALTVFAFADLFAGLFFFGDAALGFRFVAVAFRFFAAPIAAPESPPITVPTTGTPKAVPATAPATAPPSVLAVEPIPVSTASFSSSFMFLTRLSERLMRSSILLCFFSFPPWAFSGQARYPHQFSKVAIEQFRQPQSA